MTRFLFASLLVLLLVAPLSTTYVAADNSNKSSNASVGTKELLARIEALEEIVQNLGGNGPDVSGSTYRTFSHGTAFAAFNPFAGKFHLVSFTNRLLTFNTDGTGYWSIEDCAQHQLTEIGNNPPVLLPPGCAVGFVGGFTYVQSGNDVEITGDGMPSSIMLTVSNSGDAITTAGSVVLGDANTQFTLANSSIVMGVRVENLSF